MKVLMANLPGVKLENNGTYRHYVKAGSRWPMTVGFSKSVDYYPFPFWLAYTTALLKRDTNVETKGLDGVARDMLPGEFFAEVEKENPDILVVELVGLTLKDDLSLLREIKNTLQCIIVVCGYYVSTFLEKVLIENDLVDFAAFGEYEITIKELIHYLENKKQNELSKIDGLVFRDPHKRIIKNKPRPLLDVNILPYPDREDFPPQLYADFAFYSPCVSIISSRGCPCNCIYCLDRHVFYKSPAYRTKKAEDVVEEIEYCISRYKARQIYFDDQSFVVNKQHVLGICEIIKSRGLRIPWTCMGDAMFTDYEMLKAMKEAGCIGMKFGAESASPEILSRIKKPINLERIRQVVQWSKELGIRTHATFCIGLPGETEETIQKSIDFMGELGVDTAQVSRAVPYPGTPLYDWAKQNSYLVTEDLSRYDSGIESILTYPQISSDKMNQWYKVFLKKVSRKKTSQYLMRPVGSFLIFKEKLHQKGIKATFSAIRTFLKRAL